jgi:glycosyltransferase involved in cell wall biosynthesis
MDRVFSCDFYIGDHMSANIEMMNYNELSGFRKKIRDVPLFGNFYWQRGALCLSFRNYGSYIITGEPYCLSTWFILIMNKVLGNKTYLWTHGWYGRETPIKKIVKKYFFALSSKVLLYGDYARDLMIKEGFRPNKLVCIYNSLDYDNQCRIRERLSLSKVYNDHFHNDFPVILYIGRIHKQKRIDLLIEALARLKNSGVHCNLAIIGAEVDDSDVRSMVSVLGLNNNVWFYGPCYDESLIGNLVFNAAVCVSPGNVGLTAIHSLVYGTPVITHNNFSFQMPEFEVIEKGVTGDFFEKGSVEDLCEKILPWLSLNVEQRERLRDSCYSSIRERYNPYKQIEILKLEFPQVCRQVLSTIQENILTDRE